MSYVTSARPMQRVDSDVLKGFLDAFMNLTDLRPTYTGERCLVEKNAVGGCDKCMQACPHDAVRIDQRVTILEEACTGCGLCVQVCPSGALEYDLLANLGTLKTQGTTSASSTERVPANLKCSKVPGDGATLECLGRVTPAMLLASAAWGQRLTLARSDCDTCKLGGPSVPAAIENVVQIAQAYREHLTAPPLEVSVAQYGVPENTVRYGASNSSVQDNANLEPVSTAPLLAASVSRRDAMQAMLRNSRGGGSKTPGAKSTTSARRRASHSPPSAGPAGTTV